MGTRLRRLLLAISTTTNWLAALMVWLGLSKSCIALFRNGQAFRFDKTTWEDYLARIYLFHHFPEAKLSGDTITFKYKEKELIFNCGRYGFGTVLEIFGGEPYREFFASTVIKGKTVLDVGAAFGDTAITFLLAGAKHVYAVEAFPGYYRLAQENIKTNGFADSCDVLLSAMGGKSGVLKIDKNLEDMFGVGIHKAEIGDEVPIVTLADMVEQHNIQDGILKLDVEGYEYEILLNTPKEIIRCFSDLVIEYHYGFEKLRKYLEDAGFSVVHTKPHLVYMPQLEGEIAKHMTVGNIYASLRK